MDKKENIELFKKALCEGLSNRFDRIAEEYTDEIVCSKEHELAMKRILRGKAKKPTLSAKARRIIAILVAAALLLTGCALIYRQKIKSFVEKVYESFMSVEHSDEDSTHLFLNETYELTYIPEGYELCDRVVERSLIRTNFTNQNNLLIFEQKPFNIISSYLDVENGYTKIVEIKNYDVYFRNSNERYYYIWYKEHHSLRLISDNEIPTEELQKIVDGAKIK